MKTALFPPLCISLHPYYVKMVSSLRSINLYYKTLWNENSHVCFGGMSGFVPLVAYDFSSESSSSESDSEQEKVVVNKNEVKEATVYEESLYNFIE